METKEKEAASHPDIPDNEIRISAKSGIGRYVKYIYKLMQEEDKKFCVLKAAGRAMEKVVPLVEVLKRRIKGLHQHNKITSSTEKREDGSERVILTLEITISKEKLTDDGIGYQKPIPESEVEEFKEIVPAKEVSSAPRGTRGTRGARGHRGSTRGTRGSTRGAPRGTRGSTRGAPRGTRGSTRGGRGTRGSTRGGRGRGGYSSYYHDDYYGEYQQESYYDDYYDDGYYGESHYHEKPAYKPKTADTKPKGDAKPKSDAKPKTDHHTSKAPIEGTRGRGRGRGRGTA